MKTFVHGERFTIFELHGYNWAALTPDLKMALHHALVEPEFSGSEPNKYGFTKPHFDGMVYCGAFAQQYTQPLRKYSSPVADTLEEAYPYEDRFYLYVPSQSLFILENRRFPQEELTFTATRKRVERLLAEAVGQFVVSLKPFQRTVSREELIAEFLGRPTLRIKAEGLKGKVVRDDFVFFNPHFEKNQAAKELFTKKILPSTDAIELSSLKQGDRSNFMPGPEEDLRTNPLAKLLMEIASEIRELEVYDQGLSRRRTIRYRYTDRIDVEGEFPSPDELKSALLERLVDLPGFNPNVVPDNQLKFRF